MTHTLHATERTERGKQLAALRKAGTLPAVVYGPKEKAVSVSLSRAEFEKAFKEAGESTVIVLSGIGDDKEVLVQDIAHDPVLGTPLHVDFYAIEKGKKVTVHVPLEFVGEAPAIKKGAVLTKVLHELEVEAMPKDLPHEITVDVSGLAEIDDALTVADITAPDGVEIQNAPDETVVVASEVEEESEEDVAPIDMSAIEVEEKGKKETDEAASETQG